MPEACKGGNPRQYNPKKYQPKWWVSKCLYSKGISPKRPDHSGLGITPPKINMEAENPPFEKETHLPNLHFGLKVLVVLRRNK